VPTAWTLVPWFVASPGFFGHVGPGFHCVPRGFQPEVAVPPQRATADVPGHLKRPTKRLEHCSKHWRNRFSRSKP